MSCLKSFILHFKHLFSFKALVLSYSQLTSFLNKENLKPKPVELQLAESQGKFWIMLISKKLN